jgi:hypothetical protein
MVARAGARWRLPLCSLAASKQKSQTAGDRVATRLLVRGRGSLGIRAMARRKRRRQSEHRVGG